VLQIPIITSSFASVGNKKVIGVDWHPYSYVRF